MDINQIPLNAIIEIVPATTKAWSRPIKTEGVGHVCKGEQYKVHKTHEETGLIELDEPAAGWPDSLHPVSWGGVWIDARFVKLPGTPEPAPDPEPIPVTGDGSLKSLAAKLGRALLDWSEE